MNGEKEFLPGERDYCFVSATGLGHNIDGPAWLYHWHRYPWTLNEAFFVTIQLAMSS